MRYLWFTKVALVNTTAKECSKWGLEMFPVTGSSPEKVATIQLLQSVENLTGAIHMVTNYETVNSKECRDLLKKIEWDVIVIDEVHRLRGGANPTPTAIWENTNELIQLQKTRNNCYPIFLSGSIINNKPEELWAYLHMFDAQTFKDKRDFANTFANKQWIQGLGFTPKKLLETLAPSMIRHSLLEVAKDIPQQNILEPDMIELEKGSELWKLHRKLADEILVEFETINPDKPFSVTSILARLHYLRLVLLSSGTMMYTPYTVNDDGERVKLPREPLHFNGPFTKLDYIEDKVVDLVDQGENVIVFSAQFNGPLDYLSDRMRTKYGYSSDVIKGGTDVDSVQTAFQENKLQTLFINLKSGAEGLNLQKSNAWPGGSSNSVYTDQWWNPELNKQGFRRTQRIGTLAPTFVHRIFVKGSVDLMIEDICQGKMRENESITEASIFRAGDWKQMLNKYLGD